MAEQNSRASREQDTSVGKLIGMHPPKFLPDVPALWFAQLEYQFEAAGIMQERTKFVHAAGSLDAEVLRSVADLVINPPTERPYEALKTAVLREFCASADRLQRVALTELVLGDLRPSQLLRRMRANLGDRMTPDAIRVAWLDKLPTTMRVQLVLQDGSLDRLAELADRLHEVETIDHVPYVATIDCNVHQGASPEELGRLIQRLTIGRGRYRGTPRRQCMRKGADRIPSPHSPSRASPRISPRVSSRISSRTSPRAGRRERVEFEYDFSPPRSSRHDAPMTSSRTRAPTYGICWYHTQHGDNARNCRAPCAWYARTGPSAGN